MASEAKSIKYLPVREFRERGYLQEVNRCFLHPLGLALEVRVDADGTEHLGGIWDYRDDPEGMRYADGVIDVEKARAVWRERVVKTAHRVKNLGYNVQPSGDGILG